MLALIEFDHAGGTGGPLFALKGGTALNFFHWNLPRLSVDIDLTYCPINDRETALQEITRSMHRLVERVVASLPGVEAVLVGQVSAAPKVLVRQSGVGIKVEPNSTIRGTVYETSVVGLQPAVEARFEMAVTARRLSVPDLYGGKICAALDRQHPRDLFDVGLLLNQEGLTREIRTAFLVYLLSHNRPLSELLAPNFKPLRDAYDQEFSGMTTESVTLEHLETVRERLLKEIHRGLTDGDKRFLISFKRGQPDWNLLDIPHLSELPAIQWKLHNISRLRNDTVKHSAALRKLEQCLTLSA